MGAAERTADDQVEGNQFDRVPLLAARRAFVDHGAGALEHERLEEEGRGDERGVVARLGQRLEGSHEHGVEARVGVALLGHLVGHLESGQAARHPVEVLAHDTERIEHLDLVDDVEIAPALPQQEVHVGQRLQPGPELRRGAAHTLGDRPDLAVVLGEEHHDAVGLAQAVGAQDDAPVAEEARRAGGGRVVARGASALPGRVEGAVALAAPGGFGDGAPRVRSHGGGPVSGLLGRPDAAPGRQHRASGARTGGSRPR